MCTGTSATSTASSDMVAEGDSKNGISDVEDSPAIEFDDSPLLFPELVVFFVCNYFFYYLNIKQLIKFK